MTTIRLMLGGIKSLLPSRQRYSMRHSVVDANYGYAVWMRHVAALGEHVSAGPFKSVVELGPGNSIATGVCAVLSGAQSYTGIDVLNHLARDQAQRVFDDIAGRFRDRAAIPGTDQYPHLCPQPASLEYPLSALRSFRGNDASGLYEVDALSRDVVAIANGKSHGTHLKYLFPWTENAIEAESIDLIFSQAVLEEIPHSQGRSALRSAFITMKRWLRPGGIASHQVDLGMYGLTPWNVHWTWGDKKWALIRGRRDNFVNRVPLSTYIALAESAGFEVLKVTISQAKGVPDSELTPRFRKLDSADKSASGAHLILRRRIVRS